MESLAGASFKVSADLYKKCRLNPVADATGIHFQQSVESNQLKKYIYLYIKTKPSD